MHNCKTTYIYIFIHICMVYTILPTATDIRTYLNNSCRIRIANPWLWGPLNYTHHGKETGTAACHDTDAQYPVATPPRTHARTHASHSREMPQDKRYICKQITHTHAHPYTHTYTRTYSTLSRRQSEARNFLCDHIASGPCVCVCWLPPCHAPQPRLCQISFIRMSWHCLTVVVVGSRLRQKSRCSHLKVKWQKASESERERKGERESALQISDQAKFVYHKKLTVICPKWLRFKLEQDILYEIWEKPRRKHHKRLDWKILLKTNKPQKIQYILYLTTRYLSFFYKSWSIINIKKYCQQIW